MLQMTSKKIKIDKVIKESINKFKNKKPKITRKVIVDSSIFIGTEEMWEIAIDNILENALRYANKKLKLRLKKIE